MKLIKYGHSCFKLEKDNYSLIVDPGNWSSDLVIPSNVAGVIITHEHPDHFDFALLHEIVQRNSDAVVYAPASVTAKINDLTTHTVTPGDQIEAGPYTLQFIGGVHATIHASYHEPFENVGVIVNGVIYHPGDALAIPEQSIDVLSLPICAPWEKLSESIDFLTAIKPRFAFPSHDAILSDKGRSLYDQWHNEAAKRCGTTYQRLVEPIEIDG